MSNEPLVSFPMKPFMSWAIASGNAPDANDPGTAEEILVTWNEFPSVLTQNLLVSVV